MISKDKVRIAITIRHKLLNRFKLSVDPDNRFNYSQLFEVLLESYLHDKERK